MEKQLRKLLNQVKMARTIDQMTKISKEAYDTLSNSELKSWSKLYKIKFNYQQTANHDGRR